MHAATMLLQAVQLLQDSVIAGTGLGKVEGGAGRLQIRAEERDMVTKTGRIEADADGDF